MLNYYCNDTTYDVFILSFLDVFFGSDQFNGISLPEVNLANLCSNTFPQYPTLMDCPEMGESIKYCQEKGKVITLSLGGASGSYGLNSIEQAETFATTIWEMFLGGNSSYPRPFGDAILDGVDLDIEGGSSQYYDIFVSTLKKQYFQGASKRYFISGAPQCPEPDAYLGPGQSTALSTGFFDWINIQFYNNYCDLSGSNSNYNVWSQWVTQSSPSTKIMIGLPAGAQAAGSGYLQPLILESKLSPYLDDPNFGGSMLWDVSIAQENIVSNNINYASYLSNYLKNNN